MKREEYLDDYQDHAERRPKKKKKKKKRKHRVYAFFVLLFAFLILVLGIFILFHVQKVEVKGNDYCSTEEIVKSVQNDKYSVNGLYVLAKYKLGYGKQPDCFESIKVSLKNPWTLKFIRIHTVYKRNSIYRRFLYIYDHTILVKIVILSI